MTRKATTPKRGAAPLTATATPTDRINAVAKMVLSPLTQQRAEEKAKLAELNKRLEKYITVVRNRSTTEDESKTTRDALENQNKSIQEKYGQELDRVRKELEGAKAERNKLEADKRRLAGEAREYAKKVEEEDKAKKQLEHVVEKLQNEVKGHQQRLEEAKDQLSVSKTVAKRLEKEGSALEKEVNALKAQLAKEEDGNVDLKTKIENLQDELAFEKRMGNDRVGTVEREREELAKGKKALEQTLKAEYETRLTRALAEADRAYSDERDKFRVTLEQEYKSKYSESLLAMNTDAKLLEELTAKNEELQDKLIAKQRELRDAEKDAKQLQVYMKQLEDMQARLQSEQRHYNDLVKHRNEEVQELRRKLQLEAERYRELLDQKLALDKEMEYYSRLLDDEFNRLGLEGNKRSAPTDGQAEATRGTVTKRRRVEETTPASSKAAAKSAGHEESETGGGVMIDDLDPSGDYIVVANNSNAPVVVKGWTLEGSDREGNSVTYKFKNVSLPPHGGLTVYTRKEIATSDPHVVWNVDPLWACENGQVVLCNAKGDVVSSAVVSDGEDEGPQSTPSAGGCRQQ